MIHYHAAMEERTLNITIVGLGLIGGSLGLALRAARYLNVVGWDRDQAVTEAAVQRGAIGAAAASLVAAVQAADVVVVATPVLAVRAILEQIAPHLKAGAVVTDVAGTKVQVLEWAQALLPDTVAFVGGHPMAGSEQHGIGSARADLLRDAIYCLTPLDGTPQAALERLERLVAALGARPLRVSAAAHDAGVAAISHVPFLLAAALVQLTTTDARWPELRHIAATGYRDMTRLASGDPIMHRDVVLTNAAAIAPWLRSYARLLDEVAAHLDDPAFLDAFFRTAQQQRDEWLRQRSPITDR